MARRVHAAYRLRLRAAEMAQRQSPLVIKWPAARRKPFRAAAALPRTRQSQHDMPAT